MRRRVDWIAVLIGALVVLAAVAAFAGLIVWAASPDEPERPEELRLIVEAQTDDADPADEAALIEAAVYETTAEEALARCVWGEARGCSTTEQAAVVWCVLNRVDAGMGDIVEVITAPNQFTGYHPDNPLTTDCLSVVTDVLTRWSIEDSLLGSCGRVLPREYLWFYGDGQHNHFRNAYKGEYTTWDWSLPSPYAN